MTSEEMVKNLLKWCHEAFPDLLNARIRYKNQTLLHLSSEEGYTEIVKELIAMGADINTQDSSLQTPLNVISYRDDNIDTIDTMKVLLENGANVNIPDDRKYTPLHYACQDGYLEGTRLLLERGANIEAYDEDGSSPLEWALVEEHKDVCKLLLEKEPTLLNKIVNVELGDYPIHIASKIEDIDIFKMLLQKGANITAKNKEDASAIHLAAREGNLQIVKLLINKQPSVVKDKNKSGETPLHIAAEYKKSQVVSELLEHRADAIVYDHQKSTPLHIACQNGDISIAKLLIKNHDSCNLQDKNGLTPLHLAIKNKNPNIIKLNIVKFLAQKGKCNLYVKDKDGKTALDMALEENQFEIAKMLSKEMTKHFDNSVTLPRLVLKGVSVVPKVAPNQLVKSTLSSAKLIRPPIRVQNSNECIICFGLKNGIFAFQPCGPH